jgi:hypothetical protein
MPDLVGAVVGFVFTLLIFSYIIADNPLFRLAIHIFVGVAAGYAVVITYDNMLKPQLISPLLFGSIDERLLILIPLLLCVLMITRLSPRLARLGSPALAYLVGVGGAATISGAVIGTIFPQVLVSVNLLDLSSLRPESILRSSQLSVLINGGLILLGTLTTLIYFHFGARLSTGQTLRRAGMIEALGAIGQGFIAVTFGLLFAGVYMAALTAFIERVHAIWAFFKLFGF